MGNNTNHGLFFEIGVAVALDFRALVRTPPDASNSEPLLLLMMEGRSHADIVTLRRRDVETSRRYCLLTFIMVDPTSRRWDVTTWGRHDVGTSRRWNVTTLQPFSCIAFHCSNFASKICSFNLICTCIHRTCHTQISSHKNMYLNVK